MLLEGWAWGRPRSGHPEGSVGAHVAELLGTIDQEGEAGSRREELRLLALLHDTLKFQVDHARRRTGENHHAMRARRFSEAYIDDERLLAVLELHDRPYGIWRQLRRTGVLDAELLDDLFERIPDLDLFERFVELDGSTAGKDAEPLEWFRDQLSRRSAD